MKILQPSRFLPVSRITVLSLLQTLQELKQALRDLSKGDLNNIPADYREGPWFALFFRKLRFTDFVTLHSFAHSAACSSQGTDAIKAAAYRAIRKNDLAMLKTCI